MKVLRDPENWHSSLNADGFGAAVDNLLMTAMDGEEHKKIRALLSPPFAMSVMKRWNETLVRPIIQREFIDPMRPKGRAELMREFALPFPVRVVYAMFGFPEDPDAVMKFAGWALQILAGPQTDPAKAAITQKKAMEAGQHLFEHVLPIVQKRRADPIERVDLIGFLLNLKKKGITFTVVDIPNFLRLLLIAADRTSVVMGTIVSVRVDIGGLRLIKKKNTQT